MVGYTAAAAVDAEHTFTCFYSIQDLEDDTEYGSESMLVKVDEKISAFGSRVLEANEFQQRQAVVYPFPDVGVEKACPRVSIVASLYPLSGTEQRPFRICLKKQQMPVLYDKPPGPVAPPMQKIRPTPALNASQIQSGLAAELPNQKYQYSPGGSPYRDHGSPLPRGEPGCGEGGRRGQWRDMEPPGESLRDVAPTNIMEDLQKPPDPFGSPMKKIHPTPAIKASQILPGLAVEVPVPKLGTSNPKKVDTTRYFGRQGIAELFSELVDSQQNKAKFNISLIGHPGGGKSNLLWAVAHHLVTATKVTVLWASRRDVFAKWSLRLFEWSRDDDSAKVYELENPPKELRDILEEPLLEDLGVLILDAPTCAKSLNPPATDGVAAFEWAGKQNRRDERRVIHTTSLSAFSLDERILSHFNLVNKTMRPWTRQDFVEALSDDELKRQVCATLGIDAAKANADDVVDAKLYYSGINAQWFFNLTIDEIKETSRVIVQRMTRESSTAGLSRERAINSAYVSTWDENDRLIKLFTSSHITLLLGNSNDHSKRFFEQYPMMEGRLGNGSPGEIVEADFLVNLQQNYSVAAAQRFFMGDKAQQVDVRLGIDSSSGQVVRWPTGELLSLPKNASTLAAQPMPPVRFQLKKRAPVWFVPEDPDQPFLDFFVLVPAPDGAEWELRVIQNTVSTRHSSDLDQLIRVLMGVEEAGFTLASTVTVCFIIETKAQVNLGSGIQGRSIKTPKSKNDPSSRTRSAGSPSKDFKVEVVHVEFQRTASAPRS